MSLLLALGVDAKVTWLELDTAKSVAYTLDCAAGSYSLTGSDAVFSRGYSLAAESGSYALTGVSSTSNRGHSLAAASGSYTLTGSAATLSYSAGASVQATVTWLQLDTDSQQVTTPSFSNEVELKRWYVKRKNKIYLFDSGAEADAFMDAERQADEAIQKAQKTSRRARKRLRERIINVVEPKQTIDVSWLESLINHFSIPVQLPDLIAQQDWEKVMQIHALAMQMQDEEDCELLLLM